MRIILEGRKNVIPTPTDIYLLYVVLLLAEDDGLRHHHVELDLPGHHAACSKGHLQTFILKQGYIYLCSFSGGKTLAMNNLTRALAPRD